MWKRDEKLENKLENLRRRFTGIKHSQNFQNISSGLFPRWICAINPQVLGNTPSACQVNCFIGVCSTFSRRYFKREVMPPKKFSILTHQIPERFNSASLKDAEVRVCTSWQAPSILHHHCPAHRGVLHQCSLGGLWGAQNTIRDPWQSTFTQPQVTGLRIYKWQKYEVYMEIRRMILKFWTDNKLTCACSSLCVPVYIFLASKIHTKLANSSMHCYHLQLYYWESSTINLQCQH